MRTTKQKVKAAANGVKEKPAMSDGITEPGKFGLRVSPLFLVGDKCYGDLYQRGKGACGNRYAIRGRTIVWFCGPDGTTEKPLGELPEGTDAICLEGHHKGLDGWYIGDPEIIGQIRARQRQYEHLQAEISELIRQ